MRAHQQHPTHASTGFRVRSGSVADVIVIGGGAAGTTAALVLARARRRVVILEDGTYRNRTVEAFHGFPGRDGSAPDLFRSAVQRELAHYGAVRRYGSVVTAEDHGDRIEVELANGESVNGAVLVLATGVHDALPAIDGLASRWGRSVFSCPFCDGWEHRDAPVVVIDAAPGADELAAMVRSWTRDVTLVDRWDVARLVGTGSSLTGVALTDGRVLPADAAFLRAPVRPRNDVAVMLGCAVDEAGYVVTDQMGATSHPLVWAAGDLRRPPPLPHQVVLAAADGSTAGIAVHKAMLTRSGTRIGTRSGTRVGAIPA